jgi:uncharacterized protein YdaU (DUF1376 family)
MPKTPTLAMLPWFPRDYLAATRGMTLAERGAYTDMLFYAWDSGEPLPDDISRIARMLGLTIEEFREVWPAIQSKFVKDRKGLINLRLERERAKAIDLRTKAVERAKSGGKVTKERWEKDPEGMAASLAASHAPSQAASPPKTRRLEARLEESSPSQSPYASGSPAPELSPPPPLEGERGNFYRSPLDGIGGQRNVRKAVAGALRQDPPGQGAMAPTTPMKKLLASHACRSPR